MFRSILVLLCLAASCQAATITTYFDCTNATGPPITSHQVSGPTPCSLGDGVQQGASTASTFVSYSLPAISGLTNSFSASSSLSATAGYGFYFVGNNAIELDAEAQGQLGAGLTATSAGPVRTGIIQLSLSSGSGHSAYADSAAWVQVGSYYCIECFGLTGSYPFTLGVPFGISISDTVRAVSVDFFDGYSFASSNISFSLFEADGVTPVLIEQTEPTPEPGTLGLALAGIGLLLWRRRSRRAGDWREQRPIH
jgi:MYXO-CTERM domain-containing protein